MDKKMGNLNLKKTVKAKLGENEKLLLEYFGECGVEGNKWLEDSESEIQSCRLNVTEVCFLWRA